MTVANRDKIIANLETVEFDQVAALLLVTNAVGATAIRTALNVNLSNFAQVNLAAAAMNSDAVLTDAEANAIKTAVEQRIIALKQSNSTKIIAGMNQIGIDKIADLRVIKNVQDGSASVPQPFKTALNRLGPVGGVNLENGLDNEGIIFNNSVAPIYRAAVQRIDELMAASLKKLEDDIDNIDFSKISVLRAIEGAGGNNDDVRRVVSDQQQRHQGLGLGYPIAPANIGNENILLTAHNATIKLKAQTRINALMADNERNVVEALGAAGIDKIIQLRGIAEADSQQVNDVRTAVHALQQSMGAPVGGVDLTGANQNATVLLDEAESRIKAAASSRVDALLLANKTAVIEAFDDINDLAKLNVIVLGDPSQPGIFRGILNTQLPQLGNVNLHANLANQNGLKDADLPEIKLKAQQRINELKIKKIKELKPHEAESSYERGKLDKASVGVTFALSCIATVAFLPLLIIGPFRRFVTAGLHTDRRAENQLYAKTLSLLDGLEKPVTAQKVFGFLAAPTDGKRRDVVLGLGDLSGLNVQNNSAELEAIGTALLERKEALEMSANVFVQQGEIKSIGKTVTATKKSEADMLRGVDAAPGAASQAGAMPVIQGNANRDPDDKTITYKGEHLKSGEVVEYKVALSVANPGTLAQDHVGKVTNYTKSLDQMSSENLQSMALQQAKLALMNHDYSKPIYVSAPDTDVGKKYGAMLTYALCLLSEKKQVNIVVSGSHIDKPDYSMWKKRATTELEFRNTHTVSWGGGGVSCLDSMHPEIQEARKAIAGVQKVAEFNAFKAEAKTFTGAAYSKSGAALAKGGAERTFDVKVKSKEPEVIYPMPGKPGGRP